VGCRSGGPRVVCGRAYLPYLTIDACFPDLVTCLVPAWKSDESSWVCRRMRQVVGPPVSALHAPICLPLESGCRSASPEEFAFASVLHAQHQEIWRTGSSRRQHETAQGRWAQPMAAAATGPHQRHFAGSGLVRESRELRGRDYLSQDQPIYFAQQWRVRDKKMG
jgi:hypothetical protein